MYLYYTGYISNKGAVFKQACYQSEIKQAKYTNHLLN